MDTHNGKILTGTVNRYRGFHIDSNILPESPRQFANMLDNSIRQWENNRIHIVWLPVGDTHSILIPTAVSRGFQFHHCEGKTLIMVRKMYPNAFVVPDASHYIGVGGIVIDEYDRILTVR